MRRNVRFRPGIRQTLAANAAYLSAMSPGGKLADDLQASHDKLVSGLPKQRAQRVKTAQDMSAVDIDAAHGKSALPLEKEIQKAILGMLRNHPLVAFVGRFNRGTAIGGYNGRESYVQFNTLRGFPDIHGCTKEGRAIYIEVKRPGKKATEDQAEFLAKAKAAGAISAVCTSVEEAKQAIEQ